MRLGGQGDPVKIVQENVIYMHYPESVLENETHKILWDFETQTDP